MVLKTITGVLVVFVSITATVEGGQSNCSNGLAGVENDMGTVCCLDVCNVCGGPGCGNINGTIADDCCASKIEASGVYCADSNEAPCIISNDSDSSTITYAPTAVPVGIASSTLETTPTNCSNGISGLENEMGTICCPETCEVCGVSNCSSNVGGTPSDCCVSIILDSGVYCDDSNEAPCIISFETTSGPTTPSTTTVLVEFISSTSSPLGGAISEVLTAAPTLYPSVVPTTDPQSINTTSEVEDNLTAGAIIGIVGGVAVVLFIIIFSVVVGLRRQRRQ